MNDSLYREQLLDIYKNPAHKGTIDAPTLEAIARNKFCGDTLLLQLKVVDDVITEAKFSGESCMVTIASAELVSDGLIGKTLEEAAQISKEDVLEMLEVELTTSRVNCATLVLDALKSALGDENE